MALAKTYLTVNGKIRSEQRAGEAHSRDYVLDPLGSVIQIYQNGWPIADACYEPYGGIYTQWNMATGGYKFTWMGGWGYRQTFTEWSSVYVRARHYSRGLSSWTSVDPLWPSEMAYGYVEGRVMTGLDPSGTMSVSSNCPTAVFAWLKKLCDKISGLNEAQIGKINDCLRRNGTGPVTLKLNSQMLKCLRNFCKSDECNVKCVDGVIPFGETGAAGLCTPKPFGIGCPEITLGVGATGSNRGITSFKEIPAIGYDKDEPIDLRNLGLVFIHELGHACGVDHGIDSRGRELPSNWQSNDVFAFCIYSELWRT